MQEKLTVARPYAAAAFRYAEQAGRVDAWSSMLEVLAMAVSDPGLARLIGHPKVGDEQLLELISEIAGDRLDDKGRSFVSTLIDAERLELAPQIAELFERRRADAAGIVTAEVTSAFQLTADEQSRIRDAIAARAGRQCELTTSVDRTLIGGAVIKIGDSVTDLSLRRRLSDLAQDLS